MLPGLFDWIKNHRQLLLLIISVIAVITLFTALTLAAYRFNLDWTGINDYKPPTSDYKRGKTLWDWLDLFVVPLMLAIIGIWINQAQKKAEERRTKNEQAAAQLRADLDKELALSNQYDTILTGYLDQMSLLLLGKSARKPENNSKMLYTIARARTLIVLQRLSSDMDRNKDRKGHVIQFLCETDLIKGKDSAISLERANLVKASFYGLDLHQVNLSETRLSEADMIGTDLSQAILHNADLARASLISAHLNGADLSGANLSGANLRGAHLNGADLSNADLSSADLSGATITREQWEKAKSLKETIMPNAESMAVLQKGR